MVAATSALALVAASAPVGAQTLLASAPVLSGAPGATSGASMAIEEVDPPAPVTVTAPAADARPAHPVVAAARQKLTDTQVRSPDGQDRAALAAYYGASGASPLWVNEAGLTPKGKAAVAELGRADDWGLQAAAFDAARHPPRDNSTTELADADVRISLAVLKYARFAKGGRVDPSQVSRSFDQRPKLAAPGAVLAGVSTAENPDAYLRGMHPQHPQFEKLRLALVAQRGATGKAAAGKAAPAVNAQKLLVNMDRWRWMPEDLGNSYVWNNLPEQQNRVIRDGKIVHQEAIIIGRTVSPTPVFSADMQFVIFHPSWGVPDGIKTNEIAPALRRASSSASFLDSGTEPAVLRRHNLKVSFNGQPVDATKVNWATADIRQYQFTQPPSGTNVLGVVKFRFPNKHDVYMHDTNERSLFAKPERMFSHGCMRVQNPHKLAEVILGADKGYSPAQTTAEVAKYIAGTATRDIKLSKPLPVHVTYFTALAQEDGSIRTFPDLYGHDARFGAVLDGKPVQQIAAADPAAKAARVVRKPAPTKTASNDGSVGAFFTGLFGN